MDAPDFNTCTDILSEVDTELRRRDYPADLREETVRKFIAALLFSAEHPDWAWCHFYAIYGRLSVPKIALLRGISQSNVRRLQHLTVPEELYQLLPPPEPTKGE